jgi:phosphoglycolate phosphatase
MQQSHQANQSSQPPIRTVLFDFDGTLIDHFQALYKSYKHTLETLGRSVPDFHSVKRAVGGTMLHTMKMLLGDVSDEEVVSAGKIFRQHFTGIMTEDIYPLPGSENLLKELHRLGYRVGLHTNKHGPSTRILCDHLNWTHWFQAIQGSEDTPWRKPDAECTQALLQKLNSEPATTIMIGDSPFDVETARRANLRCFTVATGTHSRKELVAENPDGGNYHNLMELAKEVFALNIAE